MVQLFGRITKDASIAETKGGKKVVNFSIALNDSYKPKGGEVVKTTTYVNCAYWLNTESATYLTKGKLIEVNGRISVDAYTNLQGDAVGKINFHVNLFKLYGKGTADASQSETAQPS
ncbi:MAG TPA: single-stranded DNA-binding protein, partial [Puia sp.]|nr:single-stranded DNA-binding protein [Puia sp.]